MEDFYRPISRSLSRRMLGHALAMMRNVVQKMNNGALESRVADLQQTYRYMVDFFLSGNDDPHRTDQLDAMIKQAYELLDDIHLQYRKENHPDYELLAMKREAPYALPVYVDKQSTENADPSFRAMWLGPIDYDHLHLLQELVADPEMEEEAFLAISGLTLSLLRCFSEKGVLALLDAIRDTNVVGVNERAWVGVVLLLLYYDERLRFFPEILSSVQDLLIDEVQLYCAQSAMVSIVRTLGVEWANQAYDNLQKNIAPLLSNLKPNPKGEQQVVSMDELDDFSAQLGADFQELLQENQRELIKLNEQHLDTHFAMFKEMYNSPFFSEPYHWWLPFDPDFLPEDQQRLTAIFRMLPMQDLCDSDRFAFLTTMGRIGVINGQSVQDMLKTMEDQVPEEQPESFQPEEGQMTASREEFLHEVDMIIQDYVRQAYRFFKLNPWKLTDPFEALDCLPQSTVFRMLFSTAQQKKEVADILLHCRAYELAGLVFHQVETTLPTQENIARLGLCMQKVGEYEEALELYHRAEQEGSSEWLYRQIVYCYNELEQYDESLQYLDRLLTLKPDSELYIFEKAKCLRELELFAEALDLLYQLDLKNPDKPSVCRAIVVCSIHTGDYAAALRYFNRINDKQQTTNQDWINAGHIHFLQGNRMEAYQAYRRALMQMSDLKMFLSHFRPDRMMLVENGLSKDDVYLMEDQLINSFSQR